MNEEIKYLEEYLKVLERQLEENKKDNFLNFPKVYNIVQRELGRKREGKTESVNELRQKVSLLNRDIETVKGMKEIPGGFEKIEEMMKEDLEKAKVELEGAEIKEEKQAELKSIDEKKIEIQELDEEGIEEQLNEGQGIEEVLDPDEYITDEDLEYLGKNVIRYVAKRDEYVVYLDNQKYTFPANDENLKERVAQIKKGYQETVKYYARPEFVYIMEQFGLDKDAYIDRFKNNKKDETKELIDIEYDLRGANGGNCKELDELEKEAKEHERLGIATIEKDRNIISRMFAKIAQFGRNIIGNKGRKEKLLPKNEEKDLLQKGAVNAEDDVREEEGKKGKLVRNVVLGSMLAAGIAGTGTYLYTKETMKNSNENNENVTDYKEPEAEKETSKYKEFNNTLVVKAPELQIGQKVKITDELLGSLKDKNLEGLNLDAYLEVEKQIGSLENIPEEERELEILKARLVTLNGLEEIADLQKYMTEHPDANVSVLFGEKGKGEDGKDKPAGWVSYSNAKDLVKEAKAKEFEAKRKEIIKNASKSGLDVEIEL